MSGNNTYTGRSTGTRGAYASAQSAGRRLSGNPRGESKILQITREITEIAHDRSQAFDMPLFVIIVALLAIGLLSMYSASYAYAYQYKEGNSNYFIIRQAIFAAIGFVAMYLISFYPAKRFKSWTLPLLGISVLLLIAVLFLPKIENVHRWINLGITTFQPSEIAKFAVILFCATWAEILTKLEDKPRYTVLPYIIVGGVICLLLIAEPHISCTVIVLLIIVTMMFLSGVPLKWFAILGIPTVGGLAAVVFSGLVPYALKRVKVCIDPFYDRDAGWQNIQALYAISSGGLLGVGMGNSRQKYLYIPEPQNDFVFSVVCEELGFVGAVGIMLLFLAFVLRGIAVSASNPNRFCKMLGIGITAQVGWQVLLNIAVVTNTIPNTGISLPFFSYGGTSLVMLLFEMGVLLAISRSSTTKRI